MKHVQLFEQFVNGEINEQKFWHISEMSPELQRLFIAYMYAQKGTPEGEKYMQVLMDAEIIKNEGTAYLAMHHKLDVISLTDKVVKFRGDRRKALQHLSQFIGMGKIKVPAAQFPDGDNFIMQLITQNTDKNVRLEYTRGSDTQHADLIEYNPDLAYQRSLGNIDPHPTDKVLIKDFLRKNVREVLDICIKKRWIQKPVYNFQ
jgi:hypothetical protein